MKHEINKKQEMNFNSLVAAIQQVHYELSAQASRAVNVSLTMRNWFIGCYIAEYELHGADRTVYGDKLLSALAKKAGASEQLQPEAVIQLSSFLQIQASWGSLSSRRLPSKPSLSFSESG